MCIILLHSLLCIVAHVYIADSNLDGCSSILGTGVFVYYQSKKNGFDARPVQLPHGYESWVKWADACNCPVTCY